MNVGQGIFNTSEAGFAVNRDGRIVVWNQAAVRTFGYPEDQAQGRKCWELLSGRDVFGNRSCCEGCPIRKAAFENEPISRFQIDFRMASWERRRFTVSTLMLYRNSGDDIFLHLCHPELDLASRNHTRYLTKRNDHKPLTARESEVLVFLHKGMTVPEIATALNICASTVRNHTQHILTKLHVHSRYEAVSLGRKLGLI